MTEGKCNENAFWEKVERGDDDSCWLWTGHRLPKGYGTVYRPGRGIIYAHRFSYELANGPIPEGLVVMHRCDNPPCVNPGHLSAGTTAENVADRDAKGRHWAPSGEAASNARLTEDQVTEARRLYAEGGVSQREIARRLGVSHGTIWPILQGITWAPGKVCERCAGTGKLQRTLQMLRGRGANLVRTGAYMRSVQTIGPKPGDPCSACHGSGRVAL